MPVLFSAAPTQSAVSWETLLATWQELDRESDFDALYLMDHFVTGFGSEEGAGDPCLESWTALSALALATSRVRLGILVTGNTYRHPSVLAKMATTVDHVSGGRLEFGLGASWHRYEHDRFGIPFPNVKERLDRLEEAAQVVKLLWTQDRPAFEGRYYRLDRPPYSPLNIQRPHPPLMVGGSGEKRTLAIAAKFGDACNVSGTPEDCRRKFLALERHCQEAGTDYSRIRRSIQIDIYLNDDPEFKKRVIANLLRPGEDEERLRRSILLGSVEEVQRGVQDFIDAGVQEFILAQYPRFHRASLLRFSQEVIPAFR